MTKPNKKQTIFIIVGVLIVAAIVYSFLPKPVPVETAEVVRDSLQVTVIEEGKTFVEQYYKIAAPVTAVMHRMTLEVGDSVQAGEPLVKLGVQRSRPLDPRSRARAQAQVEAARARLKQMKIRAEQAIDNRERIERLYEKGAATHQQLVQARANAAQAIAARNVARAKLAAAKAAAGMLQPAEEMPVSYVLRAPVSGRVLKVYQKSKGLVRAGEPIIAVGNTDKLEIQVEVLSQDAVRIEPGMKVLLKQWGGDTTVAATVAGVSPQGHQEISALGVEQQRVQVTAEVKSPPEGWLQMGSGYRVLAEFIVWQADSVLQIPTSALFRTESDEWAVFVVEGGEAHRQPVKIGHQTGLSAQVLDGLSEGDVVIVHPGSNIKNGVEVETK